MINFALSLLAAAATLVVVQLTTGWSIGYLVLPSLAGFAVAFFFLNRRTSRRVQALMEQVQKDLGAGRVEKAMEALQGGFALAPWQFLLGAQLHGAVGQLLYARKEFDEALPHLRRAFFRDWTAQAMLGALLFQRKDYEKMAEAFERSVKSGKKEGLAWSAYAFCWQKAGETQKAQAVLTRAVEKNPSDDRLKANLTAVQNGKKIKMRAYEPAWYQFHLEKLPPELSGGKRVVWQRR
ncbi:MAG: tetratricopeptide repeat protein [Myxococcales bacterium]